MRRCIRGGMTSGDARRSQRRRPHSVKAAEKSVNRRLRRTPAGPALACGSANGLCSARGEFRRSVSFTRQADRIGHGPWTAADVLAGADRRLGAVRLRRSDQPAPDLPDFSVAFARTGLIVACLVVISAAMTASMPRDRLREPPDLARRHLDDAAVDGRRDASWRRWPSPAARLGAWIDPGPRRGSTSSSLPLIHYFFALVGWSLCYFWIHAEVAEQAEHRHAMRAEAEALRAELEELRLQLDPHFLFNALNGVAEEIPEHPDGGARHAARPHGLPPAFARRHQPDRGDGRGGNRRTRRPISACSRRASAIASGRRSMPIPRRRTRRSRASCCSRWSRMRSSTAGATTAWMSASTSAWWAMPCTSRSRTPARSTGGQVAPAPSRHRPRERAPPARACIIPAGTGSRCRARRGPNKVVATLVLEGDPCGS